LTILLELTSISPEPLGSKIISPFESVDVIVLPLIFKLSTVNSVTPAIAVLEAPRATSVEPKVTELFANEPFAIFVSVLSGPLIVLFVNVTVLAKVAKLSLCNALLNSATLPVIVLVPKSIDLFDNVSVVALPTSVSVAAGNVSTTFPE